MRFVRGALLAVSALLACDAPVAVTHAPAVCDYGTSVRIAEVTSSEGWSLATHQS